MMESFRVTDSLPVKSGYYFSSDFDQLWNYINRCVRAWGSVIISIHGAGNWQKPTQDDVSVEFMHSQPLTPFVVDRDVLDDAVIYNNLLNYVKAYFEEEIYQTPLVGSGWSLVDITSYFAKVAPYIPFGNVNVNRKTVTEVQKVKELKLAMQTLGQFQIALCIALNKQVDELDLHGINVRKLRSKTEQLKLRKWMLENGVPQHQSVTPGNLAWWHEREFKRGNIRVINTRGNILYSRFFNDEEDEWATLFYDSGSRRWYPVHDVENFLQIKGKRAYYCKICQRYHFKGHCPQGAAESVYLDSLLGIGGTEVSPVSMPRKFYRCKKAFVVYADFEAFMTKNEDGETDKHVPSCYAWVAILHGKEVARRVVDSTEVDDVMTAFIEDMFALGKAFQNDEDEEIPSIQTFYHEDEDQQEEPEESLRTAALVKDWDQFIRSKDPEIQDNWLLYKSIYQDFRAPRRARKWADQRCVSCGRKFAANEQGEIIDDVTEQRSYITGLRGLMHDHCVEDYSNTFNVYFHNGRGYDFHHMLSAMLTQPHLLSEEPKVFAKGLERLDQVTFRRGRICFQLNDTMNFLSSSLANLFKNVTNHRFTPEDERNNKQAFPYYFFDGPDKWDYTIEDMPRDDAPYWNPQRMHYEDKEAIFENWHKYTFSTFRDYVRFYNMTDCLQLADIFESFRDSGFASYGIDPAFFMGTPSYTWAVAKREAGLLPISPNDANGVNLIHELQQNIRGGIAQVMEGHFECREGHHDYLLGIDVNSLYSWCLAQKLPMLFITLLEELPNDVHSFGGSSNYTFICSVDFDYPDDLHDAHRFYPLAPEHADGRLLTTFWKKDHYVCTADEFNFYVSKGLVHTKTHWCAIYTNEAIFKGYVEGNIHRRQEAVRQGDKMSSELFKLMNNSLYGRCIMNPAKFRNISMIHGASANEDLVAHNEAINRGLDGAKNWYEFSNEERSGFLIERSMTQIKWEYPNQIGFGVLGYAKVRMYDMVFKLQDLFTSSLTLVYTDTDSLYFGVRDWNHEHPFKSLRDAYPGLMDFATSRDSSYVTGPETQKKIGLWSDDFEGKQALEMVALRAKAYAIRFNDDSQKLKGKGVSIQTATIDAERNDSSERLSFKHYKERLNKRDHLMAYHVILLRKGVNINSRVQRKLALSVADTKRLVLPDYKRLPFGYRGHQFEQFSLAE